MSRTPLPKYMYMFTEVYIYIWNKVYLYIWAPRGRRGISLDTSIIRNSAPLGTYSSICLEPYGGPRGGAVSHERGAPVRAPKPLYVCRNGISWFSPCPVLVIGIVRALSLFGLSWVPRSMGGRFEFQGFRCRRLGCGG